MIHACARLAWFLLRVSWDLQNKDVMRWGYDCSVLASVHLPLFVFFSAFGSIVIFFECDSLGSVPFVTLLHVLLYVILEIRIVVITRLRCPTPGQRPTQ